MTGNQLRSFRESMKMTQLKFYFSIGFFPNYGGVIENHYGDRAIPQKLEEVIQKKYPHKKLKEN